MPKPNKPNKKIGRGRPRNAITASELPEKSVRVEPTVGELPKKTIGSHGASISELPKHILGAPIGYMQTGGAQHAPSIKGPAIANPPKQPARPKQAPPK